MRRAARTLGAAAALFAASAAWAAPERGVGVWDGGPSFGGAWIAHREAGSRPSRVTVAAPGGGETEAVLIRAGEGAGTGFMVSSTVARALDLEPGRPVTLTLTAIGGSEPSAPEAPTEAEPASGARTAERPAAPTPSLAAASADAEGRDPRSALPPNRTKRPASAVSRRMSDSDREPGALIEARAPRPRPGASEAPSASPRPLGRPGAGTRS